MLQLPLDQLVLVILQLILLVLLIARFWLESLYRTYPWFFGYLLAELSRTVIMSAVPFNSHVFRYFWVTTEGIIVCFYALIVGELCAIVLRSLPGLQTVSRRYFGAILALALILSVLLLRLEEKPRNMVSTFLVIERGIDVALMLFLLLMAAFLVYYPVPLNRNIIVYSVGYALYFLTKATALFIRTLGHPVGRQIGTVFLLVSTSCLIFWLFGLNRRGETRRVVIGHRWGQADETKVLAALTQINEQLLSSRKNKNNSM